MQTAWGNGTGRRGNVVTTAMVLAFGLLANCSDPVNPGRTCTLALASGCWEFLGLQNQWISEIAVTPWGVFVGTADTGIFRLESDGTWTGLGPAGWEDHLIPQALVYVPANPPRLLAGVTARNDTQFDTTSAAVFASYDRGESWVPSDGGLATQSPNPYRVYAYDLEVDPGNPERVFMSNIHGVLRSTDAGETWDFVFGDFNTLSNGFRDILIDPDHSGRIWAGAEGYIFNPLVTRSPDWGATWDVAIPRCGSGAVYETPVYALALDSRFRDRLYAGTELGLMRSEEGGADGSWECVSGLGGAAVGFAELDGALYAAGVTVEYTTDPDGNPLELADLRLSLTTGGGSGWGPLAVPEGTDGATVAVADSERARVLIGTRSGLWALTP